MREEAILEGIEMALKNAEPKIKRVLMPSDNLVASKELLADRIVRKIKIISLLYRADLLCDHGLHDKAHEVKKEQLEPLYAQNGLYEQAFATYMEIKHELLENL
ncbi:hypothetical protein HOC80_02880 [archaeon]|jgi:hypothetical protein|nr:hypothetical protein [archaeon]MBT4417025.1 hypothetical protein [archaeon]